MIKRHKYIVIGGVLIVAVIGYIAYRRRKLAQQAEADAAAAQSAQMDASQADPSLNDPSADTGTDTYGPSSYLSGGILGPAGGNAPLVVSWPAQGAPPPPQPPDVATVNPAPGASVNITTPVPAPPPQTVMSSGGPPASTPAVHAAPPVSLGHPAVTPQTSFVFASENAIAPRPATNTGGLAAGMHSANYHPNAAKGNKYRWTDGRWRNHPQPGQHYY